ncbi:hypothetical protein Bca52824_023483 [Brassica carinata]|uniref:Uncharacterized protein n=1 Tax=Brassica carinata TaxID=52824 RepID=A0A8X7VIK1_BRACI|nr:hypothetical protein Bca52824_023483 [Brassica carinata]
MTKVINNHRGHVESCIVHHYLSQLKNGPHAFSKCTNLKTLKLTNIFISQPSVLSGFLAAFSSLEVIVLNVNFLTPHGVLKIENNSLKFLQLSFPYEIDGMEVYPTCLNVLDIDSRFINAMRDNFILVAPSIKVNKNAWLDHGDCPHLYYNVSSNLAQSFHQYLILIRRKKTFGMSFNFDDMRRYGCLSVSVDITDPKEMQILKEVLLKYWTKLVMELEIFFKPGANAAASSDLRVVRWRRARVPPAPSHGVQRAWRKPIRGRMPPVWASAAGQAMASDAARHQATGVAN